MATIKKDEAISEGMSIKTLAGTITAITVILAAAFFIDGRYVHAETFKNANDRQEIVIERNALETRKYYIEDRISSIEAKPTPQRSEFDNVNLSRYLRDRSDVDRRLRDLAKPR